MMKKRLLISLLGIGVIVIGLGLAGAFDSGDSPPAKVVQPAAIPTPTSAPEPTATPVPIDTPGPEPTRTPVPTDTQYLSQPKPLSTM